jgi:hypothetical protein
VDNEAALAGQGGWTVKGWRRLREKEKREEMKGSLIEWRESWGLP